VKLPIGFQAAGVACGIKSDPNKLDLSLFISDRPCASAGVYTQNQVVGSPVKVDRERTPRETTRGVILNSGNSNACTGEKGIQDALWMTAEVASRIGCVSQDVLVCSTGVIGRYLPTEKIAAGIPKAVAALQSTEEAFLAAAQGMMTTDTVAKQAQRTLSIGGKSVTISGACKGAAMIAPNMATMLAVVMTDLATDSATLQTMLKTAVDKSFNCISIDQHTSTSDTVLLLANGASGAKLDAHARHDFEHALKDVCQELSTKIIRDAEGAKHFVTIDVIGCRTYEEAHRIGKSVADSPLVKTAICGNDPNWGRIVSAAGYCGVPFQEEDCSLAINALPVYENGAPTPFDPTAVSEAMQTGEVHLVLAFSLGSESARIWTSDLTEEYVHLNADYTT
jgi:glutamate N-acetyltransferase/amino-acid N-acetyltransferase